MRESFERRVMEVRAIKTWINNRAALPPIDSLMGAEGASCAGTRRDEPARSESDECGRQPLDFTGVAEPV